MKLKLDPFTPSGVSIVSDNITVFNGGGIGQTTADSRYLLKSGDTATGDLLVPDEAYGSGWDGSTEVPTKNSLYDKIEAIVLADGDVNGPASATDNAIARYDLTTGKLIQNSAITIDDTGLMVQTATSTSTSGARGYIQTITSTPASAASGAYYGADITVVTAGTQNFAGAGSRGLNFVVQHGSSGTLGSSIGVNGTVQNTGAGTVTTMTGLQATMSFGVGSSATATNIKGMRVTSSLANLASGLTVTALYGLEIDALSAQAAGTTVTSYYGLRIQQPSSSGTMTNTYGIRVESQVSGGTQTNTPWGVYQAGTADKNYFGALTGFGVSTAASITSRITLPAGTTAADGLLWGSDTTLYRSAANTLKTDDEFVIGINGGKDTLALTDTTADVGITIGADTNIYRSAANTLKTDDALVVDSTIATKAGTSTGQIAKVGGVVFDNYADAGNTGTGEDDLHTNTLAASILGTNGDKVVARYGGVFNGAAAATQELRMYFGGTKIYDSGALAIGVATNSWTMDVTVIRESSTVVRCAVSVSTDFGTLFPYSSYTRITGLTLTNTQILKITGEAAGVGAADNQIVAKLSTGEWKSAA